MALQSLIESNRSCGWISDLLILYSKAPVLFEQLRPL